MGVIETLRNTTVRFNEMRVNFFQKKEERSPFEQLASIADRFYYAEPKYGIDGEKKKRRKEFYSDAMQIRELTETYPELLDPLQIEQLPVDLRRNILELLGMWMPARIKTPEDPGIILDPDQQEFYNSFGKWANGIANCTDIYDIPFKDSRIDFATYVNETSKIPKWVIREHFGLTQTSRGVQTYEAKPMIVTFNDGTNGFVGAGMIEK